MAQGRGHCLSQHSGGSRAEDPQGLPHSPETDKGAVNGQEALAFPFIFSISSHI